MAIAAILRSILSIAELQIPKKETPYKPTFVREVFGSDVRETDEKWLVPCSHTVAAPAPPEKISDVAKKLNMGLPEQLSEFLCVCDGAELFVSPRLGLDHLFPGSVHIQYRLFGTSELVDMNRGLLENFMSCVGDDPAYRDRQCLNYVAFGDAGNGDYYGIGLEGERTNQVFLVHHELYYAPYVGDGSEFLYYGIAESLEAWFQLILDNAGWGGRGEDCGGF